MQLKLNLGTTDNHELCLTFEVSITSVFEKSSHIMWCMNIKDVMKYFRNEIQVPQVML